ncbi:MAG: hypothetical protein GTO18_11940 [Anaerolineales bacterium]|nr:hypothetical protein [Anaerolineales bacterium]
MKRMKQFMPPTTLLILLIILSLSYACTATPTGTSKPSPPTSTPSAPAPSLGPVIEQIPDQRIEEGSSFEEISLSLYVSDPDHQEDQLIWSYAGNVELGLRIEGQVLSVTAPDEGWSGTESILLQVCDPDGNCDSAEVEFTIAPKNDPPSVSRILPKIILQGEAFPEIALDKFVTDPDNSDGELIWEFSGSGELEVSVRDGVATIEIPTQMWHGSDRITFTACDPGGLCDSSEVDFVVLGDDDLAITFIGVEGFLINAGGRKILVDTLFREDLYDIPTSAINAIEKGQPPFDEIDLVLVTHDHFDHFDPDRVVSYIHNHHGTPLISTEAAVATFEAIDPDFEYISEFVHGFRPSVGQKINTDTAGIELEILNLPHSGSTEPNLGFIIEVGGWKLIHIGDHAEEDASTLLSYQLSTSGIDVAFIPWISLTAEETAMNIHEAIDMTWLIPMHYRSGNTENMEAFLFEIIQNVPDAVTFYRELDTWMAPTASE